MGQVLNRATPALLHRILTGWNWDWGRDHLLSAVALPQLDAGSARHLFWTAFLGDAGVADYSEGRAERAARWRMEADYALFDRIGRRAATTGFATAEFRTRDASPYQLGGLPSEAEQRKRAASEIAAAYHEGRVDWQLADTLASNSGRDLQESDLGPADIAILDRIKQQFGSFSGG